MKIVISSGHGKYIRGAEGPPPWGLDEVDEARRVVDQVAIYMGDAGIDVTTFHDNTSHDQDTNLATIVDFHNDQDPHDYDISVHFNSATFNGSDQTTKPVGTECWYVTQQALSGDVATAIAAASGLPDRGAKHTDDLYFLNHTVEKALLIEVCFVNSSADAAAYRRYFDGICENIAQVFSSISIPDRPPGPEPEPEPPPAGVLFQTRGRCSWFGGPDDTGVSSDEGLAFIYEESDAPHLFLPDQPPGTSGLARRLNPGLFYVACRWDYDVTPKTMLADPQRLAMVRAGDRSFLAWPADWGPHGDTNRVADLSPGLLEALGLSTDDSVEVIYPWTA